MPALIQEKGLIPISNILFDERRSVKNEYFDYHTIGVANLVNQYHRILYKKGLQYNILLVGEGGVGKSAFIQRLLGSSLYVPKSECEGESHVSSPVESILFKNPGISEQLSSDFSLNGRYLLDTLKAQRPASGFSDAEGLKISEQTLEFMEKSFKVKLSVFETSGFGDFFDNTNAWDSIVKFIQKRYESYFNQELLSGPTTDYTSDRLTDTRIHACVYFISNPFKLSPLDIITMKKLAEITNLIPIISKADLLTEKELDGCKNKIRYELQRHQIKVYELPTYDEKESVELSENQYVSPQIDEDYKQWLNNNREAYPFAVFGATKDMALENGRRVKGRFYSWGTVEAEESNFCDFAKCMSLLIRNHLYDLISKTHDCFYSSFCKNTFEKKLLNVEKVEGAFKWIEDEKTVLNNFEMRKSIAVAQNETRIRHKELTYTTLEVNLRKKDEYQSKELEKLKSQIEIMKKEVKELKEVKSKSSSELTSYKKSPNSSLYTKISNPTFYKQLDTSIFYNSYNPNENSSAPSSINNNSKTSMDSGLEESMANYQFDSNIGFSLANQASSVAVVSVQNE